MEITRSDFLDMLSKWKSEGSLLDLVVSDQISNEGKSLGMITVCRVASVSDENVEFEWKGGSLRIFPFLPDVRFWYGEPPPDAPPGKFDNIASQLRALWPSGALCIVSERPSS
jgi:hypothetical protein